MRETKKQKTNEKAHSLLLLPSFLPSSFFFLFTYAAPRNPFSIRQPEPWNGQSQGELGRAGFFFFFLKVRKCFFSPWSQKLTLCSSACSIFSLSQNVSQVTPSARGLHLFSLG